MHIDSSFFSIYFIDFSKKQINKILIFKSIFKARKSTNKPTKNQQENQQKNQQKINWKTATTTQVGSSVSPPLFLQSLATCGLACGFNPSCSCKRPVFVKADYLLSRLLFCQDECFVKDLVWARDFLFCQNISFAKNVKTPLLLSRIQVSFLLGHLPKPKPLDRQAQEHMVLCIDLAAKPCARDTMHHTRTQCADLAFLIKSSQVWDCRVQHPALCFCPLWSGCIKKALPNLLAFLYVFLSRNIPLSSNKSTRAIIDDSAETMCWWCLFF